MQKSLVITGAALGFLILSAVALLLEQKGVIMAQRGQSQIHAPEFPAGLPWLNTVTPLSLAGLRGKVVLLDFWTYCCINCIHVLPELKALEQKYPHALVVIGVHSAKFDNERDTDNIRQAILRYDIEHPVVNDRDFRIWRSYTVRAWPTLVVIDPSGYIVGSVSGEGHFAVLDHVIGEVVQSARAKGALDETPRHWRLEKDTAVPGPLAFPGKVVADEATNRLFIADSKHHRILIADLQGNVLDIAGSGREGQDDGPFAQATFHHPQGMAVDGEHLYVADTENHLIRRLDLPRRTVETLIGTGHQGRQFNMPGVGRKVALSSPWDVVVVGRRLYIAMAGFHQIWVLDVDTLEAQPFAGSGGEAIVDGPRLEAALAQPSGLATNGTTLYVADSETSAIRTVDLGLNGHVNTIVGEGLFAFGDQDGDGAQVRLQHPLGLAWHGDRLYVADTYNHKIKLVFPDRKAVHTYLGHGRSGHLDGQAPTFYEPGGVSVAAGKLYIADTNNHAIRVVDLHTGEVTTLHLANLVMPAAMGSFEGMAWMDGETIILPSHSLKAGAEGQLVMHFELPAGYKLNPIAPVHYEVHVHGEGILVPNSGRPQSAHVIELPLTIPFRTMTGVFQATLDVETTFYWCRDDDTGLCLIQSSHWHVPVDIDEAGGPPSITLSTTAQLQDVAGAPLSPSPPSRYKGNGKP